MSARVERCVLAGILVLFVALAIAYSVVIPLFEASDELWHYPMVKAIADNWALPVQDPANVGPWRQEGSQPPLYYLLGALVTSWIDTSGHGTGAPSQPPGGQRCRHTRWQHQPGGPRLVVERFPWRGTVLAVHLVRFLSILMSTAGVYLTWRIVREVLPQRPVIALAAAAVHAFTPMAVFIAAAVNNDNLVVPLSSLALLILIRLVKRRPAGWEADAGTGPIHPPTARYLLLGVVLGLAALTKASSLALTLLTALVVMLRALRRRSWVEFLVGGLVTLVPLLAVAGWWYLRNLRLYGDLSGLNMFVEILGKRDVPADLAQLWRERYSFAAGYWGNFGGLNVPMPDWVYRVLNTVAGLAFVGLFISLGRWLLGRLRKGERGPLRSARHGHTARWLWADWAFVLVVLWGLGVLIPWSQWASVTWSSQGRLIFAALPVWSLMLVLGLAAWLPQGWGGWVGGALGLLLLGLSVAAPAAWITPAYALPKPLTDRDVSAIPYELRADFGTVMRLLGYDLDTSQVVAGDQVSLTLYWEARAPADRDLAVFVHLVGEHERLIAQRDTFPGLGRLSAKRLQPGFRWADRYVLQLPGTAYAPDLAEIAIGMYDPVSGVRLPVRMPGNADLSDQVRFGAVEIVARPGEVPNPSSVEFAGRMALVGYGLDRLAIRPGEGLTLTLYWRGLVPMDVNYTVSAQLVDPDQRKAAQRDGAAPTAAWKPGQMVTDAKYLEVYADSVPGMYDLRLVVYVLDGEAIVRLPVVSEGGQMLIDHIVLTRVRVLP